MELVILSVLFIVFSVISLRTKKWIIFLVFMPLAEFTVVSPIPEIYEKGNLLEIAVLMMVAILFSILFWIKARKMGWA